MFDSSRYTRYVASFQPIQEWDPAPDVELLEKRIAILPVIEQLVIPKELLEDLCRCRSISPLKAHRLYKYISKRSDIVLVVIQVLSKYPKLGKVCLDFFTAHASHWIVLKWLNMEMTDRLQDSTSAWEITVSKMSEIHDYALATIVTVFSSKYANVPWDTHRLPLLVYMNHLAGQTHKDESFARAFDIIMTATVNGVIKKNADNLKTIESLCMSSGAALMFRSFSQMPGCVFLLLRHENSYCTQIAAQLLYILDDEINFIAGSKRCFIDWLDSTKQPTHVILQLLTALAYRDSEILTVHDADHIVDAFLSQIGIQLNFCSLLVSINRKIRPELHHKVMEHIVLLMSKATGAQLSMLGTTINMLSTAFSKSGTNFKNFALAGLLTFAKTCLKRISTARLAVSYATADGLAVVNWLYSIHQLKVQEISFDDNVSALFQKCWHQGFFLRSVNIIHWLSYTCPKQAELLAASVNMNLMTDFIRADQNAFSTKRTRSSVMSELLFILILRRAEERSFRTSCEKLIQKNSTVGESSETPIPVEQEISKVP